MFLKWLFKNPNVKDHHCDKCGYSWQTYHTAYSGGITDKTRIQFLKHANECLIKPLMKDISKKYDPKNIL